MPEQAARSRTVTLGASPQRRLPCRVWRGPASSTAPEDLVRDVTAGLVRIPPFQRSFKWEGSDIVRLFDSLLRGFPIGNLLLWQRPAPAQRLQVGPLDIEAPEVTAALWVVDGQQRIVSIVGALTMADQLSIHDFASTSISTPANFTPPAPANGPHVPGCPSASCSTPRSCSAGCATTRGCQKSQLALADQAAKAIREYQIPTYVVHSADEHALLEIFTRMNTTGKRLTKSEVFQALHAGAVGDEFSSLQELGRVPAVLGFGALDDRLTLRCVLAYRGGDIFREDFPRSSGRGTTRARRCARSPHGCVRPSNSSVVPAASHTSGCCPTPTCCRSWSVSSACTAYRPAGRRLCFDAGSGGARSLERGPAQ